MVVNTANDGVRSVVCPYLRRIVDVIDDDTSGGDSGIPSCLLTVLDEIILVFPFGIVEDVSIAALVERLHILYFTVGVEDNGVNPSCSITLVSGVADGLEAVTIIIA